MTGAAGRDELALVAARRRLVFSLLVLGTALAAAAAFADILAEDGLTLFEYLALALYACLGAWVAVGFWTSLLGFQLLLTGHDRFRLREPKGTGPAPDGRRVAVLMPVYQEQPARCFASLRAAHDELVALGAIDDVDFFVLSDSRSAEARLDEALLFAEMRARAPKSFRLFYRWRPDNAGRKAGNIADWVRRFGGGYRSMIVYDADSVMGGRTLRSLVRMMDAHPQVGIIQSPPIATNRRSLFARTHQYASSVYGPIFNAGQSFWCLGDNNYIGHNAIIRVEAFARHCGLGPLPGTPPLGGMVLSHDFVEAGLMRRAGYQVWNAYWLDESFEEPPPTLIDFAVRDRRWCQGNMQHLRLLGLGGLRPLTRLHFLFGGLSYMAGGLWLAFLGAMLLNAMLGLPEGWMVGEGGVLVPHWPLDRTGDLVLLFGVTCALLLLPKALAVFLVERDRKARAAHGGGPMPAVSALAETIASILTTPILLVLHLRFVLEILLGRSVGWAPQQRGEAGYPLAAIVRAHLGHTLLGAALALLSYYAAPELFWWFSPIFTGLLLSMPISAASGSVRLGELAKRLRVFRTPPEAGRYRPQILRRFAELSARYEALAGRPGRLAAVFADPVRLRFVAAAADRPPELGDEDVERVASAVAAGGLEDLSPAESLFALADPATRLSAHRRALQEPLLAA